MSVPVHIANMLAEAWKSSSPHPPSRVNLSEPGWVGLDGATQSDLSQNARPKSEYHTVQPQKCYP